MVGCLRQSTELTTGSYTSGGPESMETQNLNPDLKDQENEKSICSNRIVGHIHIGHGIVPLIRTLSLCRSDERQTALRLRILSKSTEREP
jgi:hypothetical protein